MTKCKTRTEWLDLLHKCQNGDATCMFVLGEIESELDVLANLRDEAVDHNCCLVKELRELERGNTKLREVIKWADPYVPRHSETYRMISELPNVR